jgi:hypothetical protein
MSTNHEPPSKIGQVLSCSQGSITVLISELQDFENNKESLQIGKFLKIAQGNSDYTIGTIRNVKGIADTSGPKPVWNFQIDCQAIGTLINNENFDRGSLLLPVPTEPVYLADKHPRQIVQIDESHDFLGIFRSTGYST